ncbi:MAG: hypothetical protein ACE5DI_04005 [Candidatus Micrarchaeia archaeon]
MWREKEESNREVALNLLDKHGFQNAVPVGTKPFSNEIVWADYGNLDRFLGVLLARAGTGKSVFLSFLAWWFRLSRDCATLYFDPSDELKFHKTPQTNPYAVERIKKIGFEPCGFNDNLFRLRPHCCEGDADKKFSIEFNDLKEFGDQEFEYLLSSLLGVKYDSPAQRRAIGKMARMQVAKMQDVPWSYRHFRDEMEEKGELASAGQLGLNIDLVDSYNVFKGEKFDFKAALNERKVLALLGSQAGNTEIARLHAFHCTYLATALYEWKRRELIPETFVAREETSYALQSLEGRVIVDHEISKERKAGNHAAYVLQNIGQVPQGLLFQMLDTCICFGTKMPLQQARLVADAKMLDDFAVEKIMDLNADLRPSQWWVVDAFGDLQVFVPFTPPSQFHVVR